MNRVYIKEQSKRILGGSIFSSQWMTALLICMIMSVIIGLPSSLSSLPNFTTSLRSIMNGDFEFQRGMTFHVGFSALGLIGFFLSGPLSYGVSKQFLRGARTGEQMDIAGTFDGFREDFGGNFLLNLMMGIFIFLWTLLCIVPGIVMGYAYSFAFYVKADHPEYDWRQCLDESKRLTNGYKGELFVLDLSFIGWYFVGALACGVGTLWVAPYAEMAKTIYYLELSARANGFTAAPDGYPPPYGAQPQNPQPPYGAAQQPQYPQQPYGAAPEQQGTYTPPQNDPGNGVD